MQVGGSTPFLDKSLRNLSYLVDDMILLGRGQTTYETKKMIELRDFYDFQGSEWDCINYGIKLAQQYKPDWLLFLDSDEVLECNRAKLEDLAQINALHLFKRIWLWQDENHYRIDHPEKYQSFTQYTCFVANNKLRMERPHPFWFRLNWGRKQFGYPKVQRHLDILVKHYAALAPDFQKKQLQYLIDILKHNPFENKNKIVERLAPHFSEPILEPLA